MDETFSGFTREGLSISEACAVAGIGRTKIYQAISERQSQGPQVREASYPRPAGRLAGTLLASLPGCRVMPLHQQSDLRRGLVQTATEARCSKPLSQRNCLTMKSSPSLPEATASFPGLFD